MTSRAQKLFGFNDRWLFIVGVVVVALYVPTFLYAFKYTEDLQTFLVEGVFTTLCYTIMNWVLVRYLFIYLLDRYAFYEDGKAIVIRFVIWLLVICLFCSSIGYGLELLTFPESTTYHKFLVNFGITLLVSIAIVGMYVGTYLYKDVRKSMMEQERLKRANLQSRFETLKNQVNPHFLFNSLNTLASIIPETPDQAVKYTEKLSKVYRYILEIKDEQVIPLSDELACLEAYIYMLQIRFEDALRVNVNITQEAKKCYIVPLGLQILIENAIKHNIVSGLTSH